MITGFEDITFDLTEEELKLVPLFVLGFKFRVGKKNTISNRQIRKKLLEKHNVEIKDSRVRAIVNYIRNKQLVEGLLASSNGYFVSTDPGEVQKYIESLRQRESSIGRIRTGLQDYLQKLIYGKKTSGS